jgi:hypothetical protein
MVIPIGSAGSKPLEDTDMQASANGSVGEKARRFRRFNIEYPVMVQYQIGGANAEVEAVTKNVSIGGILMSSAIVIPLHTPLSFRICIRKDEGARCIHLAGEGKVVRVERAGNKGEVAIAVECDVPISHLEENLTSWPAKYD